MLGVNMGPSSRANPGFATPFTFLFTLYSGWIAESQCFATLC